MSKLIKGKWYWKEPVDFSMLDTSTGLTQDVNFTSNGNTYIQIVAYASGGYIFYNYLEGTLPFGGAPKYGAFVENKWSDENGLTDVYRTIDFGTEPQEVSDEFYNFFVANAEEFSIALKLKIIAENEQKVFESGKQAEHNEFWDNAQAVTSGVCAYMFAGKAWNNNTFDPKYSIKPSSATGMFRNIGYKGDFASLLQSKGITVDFSECTGMTYVFYESEFTRIGVVDCSKASDLTGTFGYAYFCETIDEVILSEINTFMNTTFRMPMLKEIRISGTIANKNVNFQWSTNLSKASMTSIINALSDNTSGLSITLPKHCAEAINGGFTTQEWIDLADSKPNWTISLA